MYRDTAEKKVDVMSLANKAALDHHFRASMRMVTKLLSVQVVRLPVNVSCLYLYTMAPLAFSYISSKFEAADQFDKSIGAHQRRQVEEKCLPLSKDQFLSGCL